MPRPLLKKADRQWLQDQLAARVAVLGEVAHGYSPEDNAFTIPSKYGPLHVAWFDLDSTCGVEIYCRFRAADLHKLPESLHSWRIDGRSRPLNWDNYIANMSSFDNGKRNMLICETHTVAPFCRREAVLWNFIDHLIRLGVDIKAAPAYW